MDTVFILSLERQANHLFQQQLRGLRLLKCYSNICIFRALPKETDCFFLLTEMETEIFI